MLLANSILLLREKAGHPPYLLRATTKPFLRNRTVQGRKERGRGFRALSLLTAGGWVGY